MSLSSNGTQTTSHPSDSIGDENKNENEAGAAAGGLGSPLITDHEMDMIHISMNLIIRGTIAAFGIAGNVINMVIFVRMGLKDSMSVGLMVLAITDFIVTFFALAGTLCFVMELYYPYGPIDPIAFHFIFVGWFRDIFYLISGWVTTFLSVERCVCVVFPFKVKQLFTKGRCVLAMITIYIVILGIHAPVIATQWLVTKKTEIPNENRTIDQLVLAFGENRNDINIYIDIANGAILPIPSQTIVFISVFLMIYGLRSSSQVRLSKPLQDKDKDNDKDSGKQESKLSSREGRLVKVVLFLAIILSVCNMPRFLGVYSKQIMPDINVGRRYGNLYVFFWNLAAVSSVVNSSVNILVYLIVNVSYRKIFKGLFGLPVEEDEK